MPPKSNVPVRICGSKTRSGCKTCKQRHVKCDENQPVCLRCQKANRHCVYGLLHPQPLEQGQVLDQEPQLRGLVALQQRSQPRFLNLNIDISPYGTYNVPETSAVKHFAACLAKDLAGCFSDDVWCHVLPRVAQHEPSIWHAIVAVSMLDTSTRFDNTGSADTSHLTIAIKHYSNAIRELNLRLESVNDACGKDVVLLSCVLFAVFECMQNHYQSALQHITGGLKLLAEWGYDTPSIHQGDVIGYLDYKSLQPIFLALESQAVQMGIIPCRDYRTLPAIENQLRIPPAFTSTQQAHLFLNHIFNRMTHWMVSSDLGADSANTPTIAQSIAEGQRLQSQLILWDYALQPFLETLPDHPATLLLLTQRKVLQTLFNRNVDGVSETVWDLSLPLFQEAIEYAETYLRLTTDFDQPDMINFVYSQKPGPKLAIAMDIVMSLFLISTKCRDVGIRRRALKLLRSCNRKEGIWDSSVCALLAERMIELEEVNAEQDGYIPEYARIHELDVNLSEDSTASIKVKKLQYAEDGHYRLQIDEQAII